MEHVFEAKLTTASSMLSEFERDDSKTYEKGSVILGKIVQMTSITQNFRDKIQSHVVTSRANRVLLQVAPIIDLKLFHFENALFEIAEGFILSKDPQYKDLAAKVSDEGRMIWRDAFDKSGENEHSIFIGHLNSEFFRQRIMSAFESPDKWIIPQNSDVMSNQPQENETIRLITKLMLRFKNEEFDYEEAVSELPAIPAFEFNINF